MMQVAVTAVIPAYNAELFIEKTVTSLLKQTLPLAEIIIVDDNSSDATYKIAKKLASKYSLIKLCKLRENCGPAKARNVGVELAKNEWILFMDADDLAANNLLEKEVSRLEELNSQLPGEWVLVHSAYALIGARDELLEGVYRWRQVMPEETLGYQFIRNHIISTSGALVNRRQILAAGGFDTCLDYSEDADLWLRLAQRGGFGYVDEPLVRIRRHPGNTSRKLARMLDAEKQILSRYPVSLIAEAIHRRNLPWEKNRCDLVAVLYRLGQWEKGYELLTELLAKDKGLAQAHFLAGLFFLYKNNWEEARDAFERTLALEPLNGAALNNMGVIMARAGDRVKAREYFTRAVALLPRYMDANHNLKVINGGGDISPNEFRITWRELREVLLPYEE